MSQIYHSARPIIGRVEEMRLLKQQLNRSEYSLVAIYGRRRVGKTYLIENILAEHTKNRRCVLLCLTGSLDEKQEPISPAQLIMDFRVSCIRYLDDDPSIHTSAEIFPYLARLAAKCAKENLPLVLFLDEFPWLSMVKDENFDFLRSFDHLLNNVLIPGGAKIFLSGSATTWMLHNLIYAKSGLAKRLTLKRKLSPFNLREIHQYLGHRGIDYSHYSLIELYMAIGGIPYYLEKLEADKSLAENLHDLVVANSGILSGEKEYDHLFSYLFKDPSYYKKLVGLFTKSRCGLAIGTIKELMEGDKRSPKPSKKLLDALASLYESDILDKRTQFCNKAKGVYYFLQDEYIRFYNKWIASQEVSTLQGLVRLLDSPSYRSFSGFNFELLCFKHVRELTSALGIGGIEVSPHIYYQKDVCQIDLLLDRADHLVTICEAKFKTNAYEMTKSDYEQMIARKDALQNYIQTKRGRKRDFNFCLIHLSGVTNNKYIELLRPRLLSAESFF